MQAILNRPNDKLRQIITVLAVVITITINALANIVPFNGLNTGQISDNFKVFFVPAGYVFSIWGVIYLGLIAFAIFQAWPDQANNPRMRRISNPFVISCIANSTWIFLWHYGYFVLTLVAMFVLLISLIVIYWRLNIGLSPTTSREKWFVNLTFSIYLGWVTVATIANITSTLDYLKWNGWGISPDIWAVIMLVAGLVIAAAISFTRRDIAYQLVLIWAFIGIAIKQADSGMVSSAAWLMAGLVGAIMVAGKLTKPTILRSI